MSLEATIAALNPPPDQPVLTAADADAESALTSSPWTVLCVDDEPNILSAMRRLFRGQQFEGRGVRVITATGGHLALETLTRETVHLVISDMRMPEMNGAQLLAEIHQRWPQTVRILLTGYADLDTTVAAINQGAVYRYLHKPWHDDEVLLAVAQVFEQHTLWAEKKRLEILTQAQNDSLRELNASLEHKVEQRTAALAQANERLKKTHLTSIKAFANLIELRGGQLVGHSRRVADMTRRIAKHMGLSETEIGDLSVAALLHDIGQIGLPDHLLSKPVSKMHAEELALYRHHPEMGEQALLALEDWHDLMPIIRGHHERYDGHGFPDGLAGQALPMGACILALADAWDDLQNGHLYAGAVSATEARTLIVRGRSTQFHPEVVAAFEQLLDSAVAKPMAATVPMKSVSVADLRVGMILAKDLVSPHGVLLLSADHVLSEDLIRRIQAMELRLGLNVTLPIKDWEG